MRKSTTDSLAEGIVDDAPAKARASRAATQLTEPQGCGSVDMSNKIANSAARSIQCVDFPRMLAFSKALHAPAA
jgi:hypothetical protein